MNSRSSGNPRRKRNGSSGPSGSSDAGSGTRSPSPSSNLGGPGPGLGGLAEESIQALRSLPRRPDSSRLDQRTLAAIAALTNADRLTLLSWALSISAELERSRGDPGELEDAAHRAVAIGQSRERASIARELHDGLGGDLAAAISLIKQHLESPAGPAQASEAILRNTLEILEGCLAGLRTMLRSLRTRQGGEGGLVDDLREIANAYQRYYGLAVELQTVGGEHLLSTTQKDVVFHVVREALANVRRHSEVLACNVHLDFAARPFVVQVFDQGVGISDQGTDGFGLMGMRERAAGIGGHLQILSTPGRGTTICLVGPESGARESSRRRDLADLDEVNQEADEIVDTRSSRPAELFLRLQGPEPVAREGHVPGPDQRPQPGPEAGTHRPEPTGGHLASLIRGHAPSNRLAPFDRGSSDGGGTERPDSADDTLVINVHPVRDEATAETILFLLRRAPGVTEAVMEDAGGSVAAFRLKYSGSGPRSEAISSALSLIGARLIAGGGREFYLSIERQAQH